MDTFLELAGNTAAACSLFFMAGLALGAWFGYSKKDAEKILDSK